MERPMHESVKLLRKELAQISALINTTHVFFRKEERHIRGINYACVQVPQNSDNTQRYMEIFCTRNSPNYDPTIGARHSEFNNSRIKATHK